MALRCKAYYTEPNTAGQTDEDPLHDLGVHVQQHKQAASQDRGRPAAPDRPSVRVGFGDQETGDGSHGGYCKGCGKQSNTGDEWPVSQDCFEIQGFEIQYYPQNHSLNDRVKVRDVRGSVGEYR